MRCWERLVQCQAMLGLQYLGSAPGSAPNPSVLQMCAWEATRWFK